MPLLLLLPVQGHQGCPFLQELVQVCVPPEGRRYWSDTCSCAAGVFHSKMPLNTFSTYTFGHQEDTQSYFLQAGTQKGAVVLLLLFG